MTGILPALLGVTSGSGAFKLSPSEFGVTGSGLNLFSPEITCEVPASGYTFLWSYASTHPNILMIRPVNSQTQVFRATIGEVGDIVNIAMTCQVFSGSTLVRTVEGRGEFIRTL